MKWRNISLRQITDFGLLELRNSSDCVSEEDEPIAYNNYKKLWKAPELLRDEKRFPKGTQKGDIYSFGESEINLYIDKVVHHVVQKFYLFYFDQHFQQS